jgi:hypothetical protein
MRGYFFNFIALLAIAYASGAASTWELSPSKWPFEVSLALAAYTEILLVVLLFVRPTLYDRH